MKKKKRNPYNPIIILADKIVPRFKRAGKWVKTHKKTIALTLGGLSVLYGIYYSRKIGINKAMQHRDTLLKDTVNKMSAQTPMLAKNVEALHGISQSNLIKHAQLQSQTKSLDERMSAIERALTNKDFHEYLKNKHGIVNLRKVR